MNLASRVEAHFLSVWERPTIYRWLVGVSPFGLAAIYYWAKMVGSPGLAREHVLAIFMVAFVLQGLLGLWATSKWFLVLNVQSPLPDAALLWIATSTEVPEQTKDHLAKKWRKAGRLTLEDLREADAVNSDARAYGYRALTDRIR